VAHIDAAGAEAAKAKIEALCAEIKVGAIYEGKVSSIKDFGAFIEISPGRDGLCHVSELDHGFVQHPTDVVNVGDRVTVKVIAIDDQDRVKLSRKAMMTKPEGTEGGDEGGGMPPPPRQDRGGERDGGGRGGDRGGRGGDRGGRRDRRD